MSSSANMTGPIGENIVITELLWKGWAPINLNSIVRQAPNVDIIAARGTHKVAIQVKTSGITSKSMMHLGKKKKGKCFNDKDGPLADFIIFVRLLAHREYESYIVPVNIAEAAVQAIDADWSETLKKDGSERGSGHPACIRFEPNKNRLHVSNYIERWKEYRDAWHLLENQQ